MKTKHLPKVLRRKLHLITEKLMDVQEVLCESGMAHVADALDKARLKIHQITYAKHKVKKI